jgi:peptidoglycan hydrolase-like protein with peptidoglycan-binding domain
VLGESSKLVRILQRKLQWLWYYDSEIDISWVYDRSTIQALYKLQVAEWLLDGSESVEVRGYFGPGTREVINDS